MPGGLMVLIDLHVWRIRHLSRRLLIFPHQRSLPPTSSPPSYPTKMVRHKKEANPKNKKFAPSRPPKPRGDASTPEKLPYKAACWDLGHCDPKRCSGKRLMQFGLMRELSIGQRFPGVVVSYVLSLYLVVVLLSPAADDYASDSPNAKKVLSPADRELLELHGAAVVECSWVRVKEVPWNRIGGRCERLRT